MNVPPIATFRTAARAVAHQEGRHVERTLADPELVGEPDRG